MENAGDPLLLRRRATFTPSESAVGVIEALPRGALAAPEYPLGAWRARTGRVVLPMRVVIGIEGLVTSVALRPGTFAALIPRYDEFVHAIDTAVATWRFTPARLVVSEPETSTSGGYTDNRAVEMYFDIDFTFDPSTPTAKTVVSEKDD